MKKNGWANIVDKLRDRTLFLMKEFYPKVADTTIAAKMGLNAATLMCFLSGTRKTQRRNIFIVQAWVEKQEKERGITPQILDENPK